MNSYKPYEYKGKTMLIERYVILEEQPCTEQEYDIFSLEPDPQIKELVSEKINLSDYRIFDDKDREQFNTFRYRKNSQNKKYYLYAQVYSKTKTKIIVNITCVKGKLWVNGTCVSIHAEHYPTQYYLTLYPIYKESEVPDHIFSHNLILFDNNYSNSYVRRFQDKLAVKYDESGYEYQGNRYDGDYVILQVIPNPYDNRLSVLIVSTNHDDLLKKHILLRKVIIPTYINGIHKFWNNEILIFDGKHYSSAYEQKSPLKLIENADTGEGKM